MASRLRNADNFYLLGVVALELWLLQSFHFHFMSQQTDVRMLPFFEPNDAITRTAAIVGAAAALLLSGVIIMAPLLSLSLHQSYDTIFEFRKHLNSQRGTNGLESLTKEAEDKLRDQLFVYQWLNPFYLGTWITSVVLLCTAGVALGFADWSAREMFRASMSFMLVSCFLIILFSVISILFFATTKPGITKLTLFVKLLDIEAQSTSASPASPAGPSLVGVKS